MDQTSTSSATTSVPQTSDKVSSKREKSSKMKWTDDMKLIFAKKIMQNKAYISTSGKYALKMEEKWKNVINELKEEPLFKDAGFDPKSYVAVQNQFSRFKDDLLKTAGISEEGSNDSGFEEPSEYEVLMLSMAKEIDKKNEDSEAKKTLKAKLNIEMLGHEDSCLKCADQSVSSKSISLDEDLDALDSCDSSGKHTSKKKRPAVQKQDSWLQGMRDDISSIINGGGVDIISADERAAKRRRDEEREDRRLNLQEQELKLRQEELKERAAERMALFNLFSKLAEKHG